MGLRVFEVYRGALAAFLKRYISWIRGWIPTSCFMRDGWPRLCFHSKRFRFLYL